MDPSGEWKRVSPDGSDWEITAADKDEYLRGGGRLPQLYRGLTEKKDNNPSSPSNSIPNSEKIQSVDNSLKKQESTIQPLGTVFDLPLPDCFIAAPLPLKTQTDSSGNVINTYRILELKQECMAYKEQYRFFRQYINSPNNIVLDRELNRIVSSFSLSAVRKVQIGKRGGRYTMKRTKDGRHYRQYF